MMINGVYRHLWKRLRIVENLEALCVQEIVEAIRKAQILKLVDWLAWQVQICCSHFSMEKYHGHVPWQRSLGALG